MLLVGVPVASMLPAAIAGLLLPARVLIAVCAATEVPARRRAMPTIKFRRRDPVKRDASMTTATVDAGVRCAISESESGDSAHDQPWIKSSEESRMRETRRPGEQSEEA
jgi:hypothetical protein